MIDVLIALFFIIIVIVGLCTMNKGGPDYVTRRVTRRTSYTYKRRK
jgi:hypothetical protein